jgi:hypothetical protein
VIRAQYRRGQLCHLEIERCAKPRGSKGKGHGVVVAAGAAIVMVAIGMSVWAWRLFR